MSRDGYNGWTNYETWRVNLELFDGYEPRARSVEELAEELRDLAEETVDHEITAPKSGYSFTHGIAFGFLHAVNWREIAEKILREYADEEEVAT